MRARIFAVALAVSSVGSLFSCGTTGSERFSFPASAGGAEGAGRAPFTNALGWTITLTRAEVSIGPIYLNVIAPLNDQTQSSRAGSHGRTPSLTTPAGSLLRIRAAYGDTDHLGGGREVGEVLGRLTFDALSPTLVPFTTSGTVTQEEVRTAEVWLYPPPGVAYETVNITAPSLEVAGEATRAGETVRFRGSLILNEAWASDAQPGERSAQPITDLRKVRGIPASFFPNAGGSLEIRFDPRPLFRGADFANLTTNPTDGDGTKVLVQSKTGTVTTDQVMRNLFQGLRASTGTYSVRWSP